MMSISGIKEKNKLVYKKTDKGIENEETDKRRKIG